MGKLRHSRWRSWSWASSSAWPSGSGRGKRQPWWRRGIKTDFGMVVLRPHRRAGGDVRGRGGVVIVMARDCRRAARQGAPEEWMQRDTVISSQPALLQAFEALLWFDLIGYWSHRAFHRIGLLWRYHAVHHSSTDLDWLSSVRVHPLNEAGTRVAQAVPLVLIGYNAASCGVRPAAHALRDHAARERELEFWLAQVRDRQPGLPPLAPHDGEGGPGPRLRGDVPVDGQAVRDAVLPEGPACPWSSACSARTSPTTCSSSWPIRSERRQRTQLAHPTADMAGARRWLATGARSIRAR